jgi:cysteine desulfurase family protein
MPRIYLDNAATSWPKPEGVYAAVDRYQRECGAAFGRSVYREATDAEQSVTGARRAVARFLGAEGPERIVFTANGTDALNLAIHGVLSAGDHVVTTVAEHNSVLRPLRFLADRRDVQVSHVGVDSAGAVDPDDVRSAMRKETRLVVCTQASNVTGAIQPVSEIARAAHAHGALFLVDAAQSLGHLPVNVAMMEADLLAAPGHKGLMGPLGTGLLYIRPGVEQRLDPLRQGGTGSQSQQDRQPDILPDKYEPGNLNVPGIVGLGAGVSYLEERGIEAVAAHEQQLTKRLLDGLRQAAGLQIHGPSNAAARVGVVSVTLPGYDPQELAAGLDAAYGIQVRAGLHCAPRMHEALGTLAGGGTVRFSLGCFTTEAEIDAAVAALCELSAMSGIGSR